MREIAGAYHRLATRLGEGGAESDVARATKATGPLTSEQVDGIVNALGSNSPVDWFLEALHDFWSSPWRRSTSGGDRWLISSVVSVGVGALAVGLAEARRGSLSDSLEVVIWLIAALGCHLIIMRVLPRGWTWRLRPPSRRGISQLAPFAVGYLTGSCARAWYGVPSFAIAFGVGAALASYLILRRVLPRDWT